MSIDHKFKPISISPLLHVVFRSSESSMNIPPLERLFTDVLSRVPLPRGTINAYESATTRSLESQFQASVGT